MTKEELRDLLLENFIDEDGDLDISELDFSRFDGNVYVGGMSVKGSLYQDFQKVGNNLHQEYQKVGGDLHQDNQEVKGETYVDEETEKSFFR